MKKLFSTFVALCLTIVLLGEFDVVAPEQAEAGILTRGRYNGIRVPRARDRNVRTSTQVMRATLPKLEYKDTFSKVYEKMQRTERRYQQQYWRWEKKKFRIEQKALRKQEKEEKLALRKKEKAARRAARNARVEKTGSAGGDGASVATDPREWFSKKIARSGDSDSAAQSEKKLVKSDDTGDSKAIEIQGTQKRKGGFWAHIKRALFGD